VIATVYTHGPPLERLDPSMHVFADYEVRCAEDAAACRVIDAEPRWLGQTERAFRAPYLSDLGYFATPADRGGFTRLAEVTAALAPLAALAPDRVLVPLGIGNHVDHVETLVAATDWALAQGLADRLAFYEDFYALSGVIRGDHPVSVQKTWRFSQAPLLEAPRLAVVLRAIARARRGPAIDQYLAAGLCDAVWSVDTMAVDERAETTQLDAIACYRSQVAAFGGLENIVRAVRAYHGFWGGAEPLWHAEMAR